MGGAHLIPSCAVRNPSHSLENIMTKATVAQLAVTVSQLHAEVVALRNEVAALKRPASKPQPQPKLPVQQCIQWLNQHQPKRSYTREDMECAATHL